MKKILRRCSYEIGDVVMFFVLCLWGVIGVAFLWLLVARPLFILAGTD